MTDQEVLSNKQRFGIIGNSPMLIHAIKVALQVANTDMTVLITGESGVGKESFSKIIHQNSVRKHGQFIAVNCGAIPEGTIDSELFGHEKGAFTGAMDSRKGYFEVTNGGTIFLDEIGEMPFTTQSRLLRVLENGEFIKVGSSKVQKTDVRVIAATNVNLIEAVEKGKFREDLYYRLNTVPIFVPPLRERGDDLILLFKKFTTDFAEKHRVKPVKLSPDAEQILKGYRWPGNIRQLKNISDQISLLETEKLIDTEILQRYLPKDARTGNLPALYRDMVDDPKNLSEREILYKILFEMRKDVTELKKLVFEVLDGDLNDNQIMKKHRGLFSDIEEQPSREPVKREEESINHPLYLNQSKQEEDNTPYVPTPVESPDTSYYENVEDISHETEDDSLSLEKKEKELIIKALAKNSNKRKYAAQDLGISERTLYRKIKQYELE